ncbi:MAG: hypothetical protein PHN63_07225, partial [Candidatus Omnitrophica bacterium]|nr:hypothetical protein [Candidatus Omnitrophota bacterium]
MEKPTVQNSIKFKILGIILFCLFLITAVLGNLSFQFSKARIVMMLGDSIKNISNTIVAVTPPEVIAFILENSENIRRDDSSPSGGEFDLFNSSSKDPKLAYEKYSTLLRSI